MDYLQIWWTTFPINLKSPWEYLTCAEYMSTSSPSGYCYHTVTICYSYHSPGIWFFSSVQFTLSVVSNYLRPHESQHARPPCPSPTPRVHSDSRPSNRWCHPAISSSVVPFSSCPQSLTASESFPMSQLFLKFSLSRKKSRASYSSGNKGKIIHTWHKTNWKKNHINIDDTEEQAQMTSNEA